MSDNSRDDLLAEIGRRYRVADMMVTMHSVLRDRYSNRALLLDSAIFLSSIIIAALAFVDPELMTWLPWSQDSTRIAIGIVAIATFALSLLAARVNWKSKSDAHDRAAVAFSQAKFRLGLRGRKKDDEELNRMLGHYEEVARNAVTVPDSDFLRLKSEHYMKVWLSRTLDRYPAASIRLAKLRIKFRHTRRMWSQQEHDR